MTDSAAAAAPLLELDNLTKYFGAHTAVQGVNLKLQPGSIFGLVGPNGAGKTTTIRMINRIFFPDEGVIRFRGEPLAERHLQHIGYMPEERGLYKKMHVREQIVYLLRLRNLPKSEAERLAQEWMERFDLLEWQQAKISALSKGMSQKVQFIATVAHQPPLIILDEPFSGLDPINTQLLEDMMFEMRDQGISIIFSTHRMEQIESLCERVALMNQGSILIEGNVRELRLAYRQGTFLAEAKDSVEHLELPEGVRVLSRNGPQLRFHLPDVGLSPSECLQWLMARVELIRFEQEMPSLREIFIHEVQSQQPELAVETV